VEKKSKSKSGKHGSGRNGLNGVYSELLQKVQRMPTRRRFAYMVSAGIYTKRGKLSERYGG
jgi:hypothetical protein